MLASMPAKTETAVSRRADHAAPISQDQRINMWIAAGTIVLAVSTLVLALNAVGAFGGSGTPRIDNELINRGTIIYGSASPPVTGSASPPVTGSASPPVTRSASCAEPSFPPLAGTSRIFVHFDVATQNSTCWTTSAVTEAGDTVRYMITYENASSVLQNQVAVGVNLAPGIALVPNSTYLTNAGYPDSLLYHSNNVASGGIVIGNYAAGSVAYVVFSVATPFLQNKPCGPYRFTSVGVVLVHETKQFYNSARISMTKAC